MIYKDKVAFLCSYIYNNGKRSKLKCVQIEITCNGSKTIDFLMFYKDKVAFYYLYIYSNEKRSKQSLVYYLCNRIIYYIDNRLNVY